MSDGTTEEQGRRFTLEDVWAIVQIQRWVVLGCLALCLLVAMTHLVLAPRKYASQATVHLATVAGQEVRSDRVVDMDQFLRWNRAVFVKTQLDILTSREVLGKVLDKYAALGIGDGIVNDGAGYALLRGILTVQVRQGTELIDISVTSSDPDLSMRMANLVAQVFRDQNLEAMRLSTNAALNWLTTEIVTAEAKIEDTSRNLRTFQQEHDLQDAEAPTSSLTEAMSSLKVAYGAANTERVIWENTVRSHERLLAGGQYVELAKDMNTPMIVQLSEQYASAATEQARLAARYGEKMPERKAADALLDRIQVELEGEVRRTLEAERAKLRILRDKEVRLQEEIDGGKEAVLDVQTDRVGYDKMKLEFQTARDNYAKLQARKTELELQARTQLNNVRIVEEARANPSPVSPSWLIDLALGLVGGLVLGLAAGFGREWLDDTISSPLEVKTFLRVPFLGMIPKIVGAEDEVKQALYTHDHPRSNIAESLRGIRTLIELSPVGSPRRLLVTSAVQSEGKTSTSVRLGVAFANLDKRVLLVDCDLRRPRLHKVFGCDRELGFSTLVLGEATPEQVIHATPVPNLFVIAAGKGGERPNELLASAAVPRVLTELDSRFDLVIIDSPPSALLSDARILSKLVDGVVMVVREHTTSRNLVRDALGGLEQVGARILGVAVNAVDFGRRSTSYKYYYGYGYRYDKYHYGEKQDQTA